MPSADQRCDRAVAWRDEQGPYGREQNDRSGDSRFGDQWTNGRYDVEVTHPDAWLNPGSETCEGHDDSAQLVGQLVHASAPKKPCQPEIF